MNIIHDLNTIFYRFLTIIILFSMFSMYAFPKKQECSSIFSQIVAAVYRYMTQLSGLRENNASKSPSLQNWTKKNAEIEFSTART